MLIVPIAGIQNHNCIAPYLQACEGVETCIVSCHRDEDGWDGNEFNNLSFKNGENRASKLSEITGLNLTEVNIEDPEQTRKGFIQFSAEKVQTSS